MKIKLLLILFSCLISKINSACEQSLTSLKIPIIEVFNNRGLRVSINNAVGLQEFKFNYKINEPFNGHMDNVKIGVIHEPSYGRWIYTDKDIQLKLDDKIYYWVSIKANGTLRIYPKCMRTVNTLALRKSDNGNGESLDNFDNDFSEDYSELEEDNKTDEESEMTPNPDSYYCLCPEKIDSFIDKNFEGITYEYKVDSLYDTAMFVLKNKSESRLVYINGLYIADGRDLEDWLANKLNLYDLTERYWLQERETTNCGHLIKTMSIVDKKRLLIRIYRDKRNRGVFEAIEPNSRKCVPYSYKRK